MYQTTDKYYEIDKSTGYWGCKMIRTYDMASGVLLKTSSSEKRPTAVPNHGPHDILHPTLQLQEIPIVQNGMPASFTPDLATKPIDSFFD